MIKRIRGVKTIVEYQGKRLLLAFTGPERMRVFDPDTHENISRHYKKNDREQLFALADANFGTGKFSIK